MSNSWAAIRRRNAPLALLIAAGALCAPACGGTAFTAGDATGGEGGSTSEGGVGNTNRGGTPSSGGARTGGAPGAQGGDANTEGGVGGDPGAGAESGTGAQGGVTSGGSSSGGASTGGSITTGGRGGSGGTTTGGKGGKGGAGGTTGGTTTGGTGKGGSGGTSGGASTGGTLGGVGGFSVGGLSVGGVLGTGGSANAPFPATSVLDNFNRNGDNVGASWTGGTDTFVIKEQRLVDTTGDGMPLLWSTRFDASQEVFATLASFDASSSEINLVLRAQQQRLFCELIEVMYQPDRARIGVGLCSNGSWTDLPTFAVTLVAGDQLGARISAGGKISVYRNGTLLTTFDASSFPYQTGGYIGVNAAAADASPATWDNFGGGNAPP